MVGLLKSLYGSPQEGRDRSATSAINTAPLVSCKRLLIFSDGVGTCLFFFYGKALGED